MSDSKNSNKPKAWMRHDKTKSGYIVRMTLDNGYKAYRPEFTCCLHIGNWYAWRTDNKGGMDCAHRTWNRYGRRFLSCRDPKPFSPEAENMAHRQIEFRENAPIDMDEWVEEKRKRLSARYVPAEPGSPKRPRARPMVSSDPIEEGRAMAADERMPLPPDKSAQFHTGVRVLSPDSEEKELEELRRRGLLYDEAEPSRGVLRLGDIWHDEPAYSIRQVTTTTRRKRAKGKSTAAPIAEGMDEEMGDFFVPEEVFESWAEFAKESGFEFVLLDDLVSNAESWVELEDKDVATS
ncbi:hypothetical protein GE09DRAFT_1223348 [Coniochaeta sp. 2T2.1]|nr:hypothetical protein GE09DRAFT_1223348 [Coniochaeta sp. 2T2.1]